MIMYKSPIELFTSPVHDVMKQMYEQQEEYIYQCVSNIGVDIDKNELIRALQYDRDQYEQGYRDGKKANEWISIKDKLPELYDRDTDWSETVLFLTTQGHIHSGYRYKGRIQTSFYDDDWTPPYWLDESENLSFEEDEVTHWMLLPESPIEKEN